MPCVALPEKHTAQILAKALREVGLSEMADKAATGYYHDFLSPLDMPELTLVTDLAREMIKAKEVNDPQRFSAIGKLRIEVLEGKHDASKEESDAWAESPEGQAAFRLLLGSH